MAERRRARSPRAVGLSWIALLLACGCGSSELDSPTAGKLRALGNFYLEYAIGNRNTGPADEKAFKKHLRAAPDFILKNYGVDPEDIDALFVSGRDQEPFVVVYGTTIGAISGHEAPLVAYEKTGKNGKRLVGFANAKVELANESRFTELTSTP